MKLSIIIPVYNVEKYIDQCLESIICQLNEIIEVILINDGSTDDSKEICEGYCRKFKNLVLYNQDNQGVSAARNHGIRKAKGEYLFFLDSDDLLVEDILSEILHILENNKPEIILGKHDVYMEGLSKYIKTQDNYTKLKDYKKPEEVFEYLGKQNPFWITVSCVVVKRQFLLENSLFFYNGIRHEDELWVPLLFFYTKKIAILDKSIYCYRVGRDSSFTKTKSIQHEFDKIHIMDEFHKIINNTNAHAEKIKMLKGRGAVLEWSLIQDVRFYKNDSQLDELKHQIRGRLKYLKQGKYKWRFWACKILGIDIVRVINLWRYGLCQYIKKWFR